MSDRWTITVPDDVADEVMQQLAWGDSRSAWVVDAIERKLAGDERDRDAASDAEPIAAVANAITIGRSDAEVDANRELVRVATDWLRAQDGSIQRSDAPLAKWQREDPNPRAPRTEKQLWNGTIVKAWRASEFVDDTPRSFAWVGGED